MLSSSSWRTSWARRRAISEAALVRTKSFALSWAASCEWARSSLATSSRTVAAAGDVRVDVTVGEVAAVVVVDRVMMGVVRGDDMGERDGVVMELRDATVTSWMSALRRPAV